MIIYIIDSIILLKIWKIYLQVFLNYKNCKQRPTKITENIDLTFSNSGETKYKIGLKVLQFNVNSRTFMFQKHSNFKLC